VDYNVEKIGNKFPEKPFQHSNILFLRKKEKNKGKSRNLGFYFLETS